jgi:hypothetical protein
VFCFEPVQKPVDPRQNQKEKAKREGRLFKNGSNPIMREKEKDEHACIYPL